MFSDGCSLIKMSVKVVSKIFKVFLFQEEYSFSPNLVAFSTAFTMHMILSLILTQILGCRVAVVLERIDNIMQVLKTFMHQLWSMISCSKLLNNISITLRSREKELVRTEELVYFWWNTNKSRQENNSILKQTCFSVSR